MRHWTRRRARGAPEGLVAGERARADAGDPRPGADAAGEAAPAAPAHEGRRRAHGEAVTADGLVAGERARIDRQRRARETEGAGEDRAPLAGAAVPGPLAHPAAEAAGAADGLVAGERRDVDRERRDRNGEDRAPLAEAAEDERGGRLVDAAGPGVGRVGGEQAHADRERRPHAVEDRAPSAWPPVPTLTSVPTLSPLPPEPPKVLLP